MSYHTNQFFGVCDGFIDMLVKFQLIIYQYSKILFHPRTFQFICIHIVQYSRVVFTYICSILHLLLLNFICSIRLLFLAHTGAGPIRDFIMVAPVVDSIPALANLISVRNANMAFADIFFFISCVTQLLVVMEDFTS